MLRSLCLSLPLLCPLPALAEGLSFDGVLGVGATDLYDGYGIAFVDATMTVPLSRRVPLTFELGAYLFALDRKRPHETYAAFAWDDRFRLGAVRPAYDGVLPSVFERVAPFLAYERAEYTRAHATVEAMRRTAVPWGVSASFEQGATQWMVSAHHASKGDFDSLSAAVNHVGLGWEVSAAVEAVRDHNTGRDDLNTKLGGSVELGQATLGLAWLDASANARKDALALDLAYSAGTRLDLLAFGSFTRDGGDDAYGIAAEYRVRPELGLGVAATDGASGSALHMTLTQSF